MRSIPSTPVRAVAAMPRVWHELPGDTLPLDRFEQHPRDVRSLRQFGTERSWWTAVEWFSRIPDRDSLCVPVKLGMEAATHLSLRVYGVELSELVVMPHRLVSAFQTTVLLQSIQPKVQQRGPMSELFQKA